MLSGHPPFYANVDTPAPEELKDTVIGVFLIIAACMMFGPIFHGVIKKIWSYQMYLNQIKTFLIGALLAGILGLVFLSIASVIYKFR